MYIPSRDYIIIIIILEIDASHRLLLLLYLRLDASHRFGIAI